MKNLFPFCSLIALLMLMIQVQSCSEETTTPQNQRPQIQNLSANPSTVKVNEETTLNCVATDPDGDNLTISWSVPEGTFPNGNTGATVEWKAPANTGNYSIIAAVSDGKETAEDSIIVLVGTVPSAPIPSLPSNGATNVLLPPSLIWNASAGAASYTLQVSENNSFTTFTYNQSGLIVTSQQITGLSYSTTYYWRVSAANNYGTSEYSAVWNFTTKPPSAPDAPILSLPSNGATNVLLPPSLDWNASVGADSYTLQVSENSNFTTFAYNQSGLIDTSQQITGLSYSTTYYWRVSATNSYGTSGYSVVWNFITEPPCPVTVIYEGKTYNTVLVGNQCWMKENLDVGSMIQGNQEPGNNGIIEKYCYGSVPNNCNIYGGLYLWDEAMQYVVAPGTQGICPTGWHIPTQAEFQTLIATVSSDGNALKAVGQGTGNGAGTNTSGFSALLGGHRLDNGSFYDLGGLTEFWSSSMYDATYAYHIQLNANNSDILLHYYFKDFGFSVRCIKY